MPTRFQQVGCLGQRVQRQRNDGEVLDEGVAGYNNDPNQD